MNFFPNQPSQFDLQNLQRLAQMNSISQQNIYLQNQPDLYTELTNKINQLPSDERDLLTKDSNFMATNQAYEQGLLAFIAAQYRTQFNQSEQGQTLLKNLDNSLNKAIESSKNKLNTEREEMRRVSDLIKSNPEILEMLKSKENGKQ